MSIVYPGIVSSPTSFVWLLPDLYEPPSAVPLVQQLAKIVQFPCCATTTGVMVVVRRKSEVRNSIRTSRKLHPEREVNNTVVGRTVQIEGMSVTGCFA